MTVILRKHRIREITGLSDGSIYRLEREGLFPQRRKISPTGRAVGWNSEEVEAWVQARQADGISVIMRIGSGKPGPGRGHKKPAQA